MARILVVDDDAASRDFLVTLLGYGGHDVTAASCGSEGLQFARKIHPDLVISDVVMPEMDGFEFARQLRSDSTLAGVRLLFYTAGYFRDNAQALADACGVASVLSKPADPEALLEAIEGVLGKPDNTTREVPKEFHEEHARLLTGRVFEQLKELEDANTRLLASELQYRALFENNPFPMWIVEEQTDRFLIVNAAAVQHYGYSREEFAGMTLADIRVSSSSANSIQIHTSIGGFVSLPAFWKHKTKTGRIIDVEVFDHGIVFESLPARLRLIQDVTERNRADRKIRDSEEQLYHLTTRLRSAHEEERTRVARYLHDELGQMLTALRMTCGWIVDRLPEGMPGVAEKMRSAVGLTDEMVVAVQKLSTELRPGILDLGVAAAIEWQVGEFQTLSQMECTVEVPEDEEAIDTKTATELYRMFQEALTNVARHSGATQVKVVLRQDGDTLVLEVRDNGRGITIEEIGSRSAIGLLGMKERAALIGGTVSFCGEPGVGTVVTITAPLAVSAASASQG